MKKIVFPFIFLLFLVSIQNSLFEFVRIFGVKPDIVLTFIICYTLINGNPRGTVMGIAGGMLKDVFFGGVFGLNSIACMICAYLIGIVEEKVYKDNIFIPSIFTFLGTILKELIVFALLFVTRLNHENFIESLTSVILPEAIYNAVLAAILFKFFSRLNEKYFSDPAKMF